MDKSVVVMMAHMTAIMIELMAQVNPYSSLLLLLLLLPLLLLPWWLLAFAMALLQCVQLVLDMLRLCCIEASLILRRCCRQPQLIQRVQPVKPLPGQRFAQYQATNSQV